MANQSPRQMLQKAVELHQQGRFAPARAACEKVLKSDPNQPGVLRLLGLVEFESDRVGSSHQLSGRAA